MEWFVSEPFINLWLRDTPLRYQPAFGEKEFAVDLLYRQRGMRLFTRWNRKQFSELGSGFVLPWQAAISVGYPDEQGSQEMVAYLPTGSVVTGAFLGASSLSGRIFLNNSIMERVFDSGNELSELRVWYSDGACDVYATGITNSYGDLIRLALTRRLDRLGHGVTIEHVGDPEYPEYAVIRRVLDPDNNALTFHDSEDEGRTNRLSQMVDWAGRTITLAYDEDNPDMLVRITDPEGMRSRISYTGGNGVPDSIITPYGTTVFEHASLRYEHQEYRCITVTRPTGAKERFYYEMDYDGVWMNPIDPRNQGYTVPGDTPYDQLESDFLDRNSYYWDARNFASLSTTFKNDPGSGLFSADDAMRARGRHWLRDWLDQGGTLVYPVLHAERAPSPDAAAQTRGQITWYDYPGKPVGDSLNIGTFIAPAVIARLMPDATTAWTWNEPNDLGHVQQRVEKWVAGGVAQYRTNTFIYDATNQLDLIEERFGPPGGDRRVAGYGYDPQHPRLPNVVTNAVGEVTAYGYDGLHRLSTILSPSGLLTTRQYGGDGYLFSAIESIAGVPQRTNTYAYAENHLYSHTDARFLTTYYTFDDLGRLVEKASGDVHESWSFGLGAAYPGSTGDLQIFEPTAYHDRLGTNWTYTTWTADRRKDSITDARGTVTRYAYCDCGAVGSVTEGYGLGIAETTSYVYDQQGRLTQMIAPDGTTVTYGYDLPGRRTTVSDGLGTTTYGYDNLDRLVSAANAAGQAQAIVYDLEDHPTSVTDANGVTVASTYDEAGRLRTRSYPGGGVEAWGYTLNVAGTTAYTNQVGNVTLYAYDAAGRRTNETQVGMFTNSFVYWPGGELRYLDDGKGNRTEWRYDPYGRVSEKQYQGQSTPDLLYSYDAAGRLTTRFTRTGIGANTNGYSTAYTYDGVGNLIKVTYPAGTASITNTFDALHRLATTLDGLGTTVYSHAVLGNGLRTSSENPPWSATDSVTVTNRFGRRAGLTIQQPSGQFVATNSYDAAGRWAVVGGTAGTFSYRYPQTASVQPIGITLPGGGYVTNWYDGVARLTRTELRTSGGTILNAHGYQYNAANQRTLLGRTNSAVSAWNGYVTATYDAAGQLAKAWTYQPNGTPVNTEKWSYGYDAAQNLSKRTNNLSVETFTVNALNQLQSIPDSTPTYDRRGNLVSRYFPANNWVYWYYTYDHENQLARVATDTTNTLAANRFRVDFTYDGQGRLRVKKDFVWGPGDWYPNGETRYLYDGLLIVQERNDANTPLVTYTRGRDLSGTQAGAGGIGGLLARSHGYSAGNWSYHNAYHADGNGNVTALVNSGGTLQASYKYDPYGRWLAQNGTLASANLMRFSSKPWVAFAASATSGLYYYGYRLYEPYLQRWVNRDPIGEMGGANVYAFTENGPVAGHDVLGLASEGTFYVRYIASATLSPSEAKTRRRPNVPAFEVQYRPASPCSCPREQ